MELLNQGLNLMTYGISTVFLFLGLLIGAMSLMSYVLGKLPAEEPKQTSSNNSHTKSAAIDSNLLSVIQAAVTEHRNRKSV